LYPIIYSQGILEEAFNMASPTPKKRMAIVFDTSFPPPADHDYSQFIKQDDWRSERFICRALEDLGHEAVLIGVFNDLERLILDLKRIEPHLVFNLTEAFNNRRDQVAQIAAVFELLEIPYTGTQSLGLYLCQDKGLSKKILAHHRIRVPRWVTSHLQKPLRGLKSFQYPAFVKPSKEEASEGISRDSFVENEKDCLERVRYLHERFKSDVMIEEFIPGREFYVSVLGGRRLQGFPIRELCFREFPEDVPKFATFKTKWDEPYRKKWGIRNEFARGLTEEQISEMHLICKKAFEFLHLSVFARFDLRLSEKGEIVMLEANPNPSLATWDDFVLSAEKSGLPFEGLIEKIVDLSA